MGNKIGNPGTSQKSFWKIINTTSSYKQSVYIWTAGKKQNTLMNSFHNNLNPLPSSVLPNTMRFIINPNKTTGSDGIFGQMLLLCNVSVILPLKRFFRTILLTSTYPDIWKLAMTPIFKKGDKQYLFSLFVAKVLEILFLIIFIVILM